MKLVLLFTGKTSEPYLREAIGIYADRLKHYLPVEMKELVPLKDTKGLDGAVIRKKESDWLLKTIPADEYLILLDEKGQHPDTMAFTQFLTQRMNQGLKQITFLVGGAFGVSQELKNRSNYILSLSNLTFTHQMTRLILLEQLYRAMTITRNEPYHNP